MAGCSPVHGRGGAVAALAEPEDQMDRIPFLARRYVARQEGRLARQRRHMHNWH